MRTTGLIGLALALFTFSASAQTPDLIAAKKLEMKKVQKFVGHWVGSGWQQVGPKRENVTGSETVQNKVDGLALLIEGRFADSTGAVKHETLAIMSYDDQLKSHRFKTFLANGISGEHDLKVLADGFEWGFTMSAGTVRFTIKLENDTWSEIGEFSRDGKTWMKTMEMVLKRVK